MSSLQTTRSPGNIAFVRSLQFGEVFEILLRNRWKYAVVNGVGANFVTVTILDPYDFEQFQILNNKPSYICARRGTNLQWSNNLGDDGNDESADEYLSEGSDMDD